MPVLCCTVALMLLSYLLAARLQAFCPSTDAGLAPTCCARFPGTDVCGRGTSKPAFFNGRVYSHFTRSRLHWWETNATSGSIISGSVYSDSTALVNSAFLAGTPVVSGNGNGNGVVWSALGGGGQAARVAAHDATTGQLLLNLPITTTGSWNKFTVPTVVNGQVYLGTTVGVGVLRLP